MTVIPLKAICGSFALFSFMAMGGCASSPDARLYVLKQSMAQNVQSRVEQDVSVLVSPVVLPDYLKRPEIIFKSGGSRIVVNAYDKWAGSLEDNVTSVMTANLSAYLNTNESFDYHANFSVKPDVTVRIRVYEFGRINNLTSNLRVSWELVQSATGKSWLFTDTFRTQIERADLDDPDLTPETQAMSQALDQLSLKISEKISDLVQEGKF